MRFGFGVCLIFWAAVGIVSSWPNPLVDGMGIIGIVLFLQALSEGERAEG